MLGLILLFSFAFFSYFVSRELLVQFDSYATVQLQSLIPRNFDLPFSILSLIGSFEITAVTLLVLTTLVFLKRLLGVFLTFSLFFSTQILELFGKLFLFHPSPPLLFFRTTLPFNLPSGYIHTEYSYPSGHAIRTTFIVIFLLFYLEKNISGAKKLFLQTSIVIFLIAMLISRIYLGEHWASDVIGGMFLGTSFGIFAGLAIPQPSAKK